MIGLGDGDAVYFNDFFFSWDTHSVKLSSSDVRQEPWYVRNGTELTVSVETVAEGGGLCNSVVGFSRWALLLIGLCKNWLLETFSVKTFLEVNSVKIFWLDFSFVSLCFLSQITRIFFSTPVSQPVNSELCVILLAEGCNPSLVG